MKLNEMILKYRKEHDISQRQFSALCGLSTGYISLIEKDVNPQTGKPMIPSLSVLNKLASGMGVSIDQMLNECDDMPVSTVSPSSARFYDIDPRITSDELALLRDYRTLGKQGKEYIAQQMEIAKKLFHGESDTDLPLETAN